MQKSKKSNTEKPRIHKILDHHFHEVRGMEYLVWWEGSGKEKSTFISASALNERELGNTKKEIQQIIRVYAMAFNDQDLPRQYNFEGKGIVFKKYQKDKAKLEGKNVITTKIKRSYGSKKRKSFVVERKVKDNQMRRTQIDETDGDRNQNEAHGSETQKGDSLGTSYQMSKLEKQRKQIRSTTSEEEINETNGDIAQLRRSRSSNSRSSPSFVFKRKRRFGRYDQKDFRNGNSNAERMTTRRQRAAQEYEECVKAWEEDIPSY